LKPLHIGITGTRSGLTDLQRNELTRFLKRSFEQKAVFHHGDCVGVDVEAAQIARDLGYKIVGHPPTKTELRGYFTDDETHTAKTYFARNRDIVNASIALVVVPWQMEHGTNGGTWYTHDYAEKIGKPTLIIWPEAK